MTFHCGFFFTVLNNFPYYWTIIFFVTLFCRDNEELEVYSLNGDDKTPSEDKEESSCSDDDAESKNEDKVTVKPEGDLGDANTEESDSKEENSSKQEEEVSVAKGDSSQVAEEEEEENDKGGEEYDEDNHDGEDCRGDNDVNSCVAEENADEFSGDEVEQEEEEEGSEEGKNGEKDGEENGIENDDDTSDKHVANADKTNYDDGFMWPFLQEHAGLEQRRQVRCLLCLFQNQEEGRHICL